MSTLAITGAAGLCPLEASAALAQTEPGAPIVIMVHGFRYCPQTEGANPHDLLFAPQRPKSDCWKVISWPKHFAADGQALVVGFGWQARGSIWEAYEGSERAGLELACVVAGLSALAPERPVHILAHSLGARVALKAMSVLPEGAVNRAIFISPAVFAAEAEDLIAQGAGRQAQVFSVLGQENALYDLLLRAAMPAQGPTLGRGGPDVAGWLDMRLHRKRTVEALGSMGYKIARPRARICHWSGYLRPGVWRLYRSLLLAPERTPQSVLRAVLAEPKGSFSLPSFLRTGTPF